MFYFSVFGYFCFNFTALITFSLVPKVTTLTTWLYGSFLWKKNCVHFIQVLNKQQRMNGWIDVFTLNNILWFTEKPAKLSKIWLSFTTAELWLLKKGEKPESLVIISTHGTKSVKLSFMVILPNYELNILRDTNWHHNYGSIRDVRSHENPGLL